MTNIGVLGGSGHVGRRVVRRLLSLDDGIVGRVVLVHRRAVEDGVIARGDRRLVEHAVDMTSTEGLEAACLPLLQGVDVVISTMGIGSGRGSAEAFRRVEVELPSAFARAARRAGVGRAVMLTGVGADIASTSSWLVFGAAEGQFFHLKGLVEKNFADLGFPEGLIVFRPGGLLGTGHVPAAFDWLLPKLDWMAPVRFRCLHVQRLAEAMASVAVDPSRAGEGAVTVLEGERLFAVVGADRTGGVPATP